MSEIVCARCGWGSRPVRFTLYYPTAGGDSKREMMERAGPLRKVDMPDGTKKYLHERCPSKQALQYMREEQRQEVRT